jgi:hypothetical protein
MAHLYLVILLAITCSLAFHAPLPYASAASGDITPIRIQNHASAGGSVNLEHDTVYGISNSLVQVDADTYALAYTGDGDDGFISTFTISADGSTITKVKTLEHDIAYSYYNSLVQVDADTYALAYAGDGDDGHKTCNKCKFDT